MFLRKLYKNIIKIFPYTLKYLRKNRFNKIINHLISTLNFIKVYSLFVITAVEIS
jgi:hypothetical protein